MIRTAESKYQKSSQTNIHTNIGKEEIKMMKIVVWRVKGKDLGKQTCFRENGLRENAQNDEMNQIFLRNLFRHTYHCQVY